MIIGYTRVSTDEQSLDVQKDALEAAGARCTYADTVSGTMRNRPELNAMLEQLGEGDVVVVTKYDRLAQSLRDLFDIVEAIGKRGAGLRSLAEDIDTTKPAGGLIFHVFASVAQFEREMNSKRTREGLEAAKRRGRVGGRPSALSDDQKAEVCRMRDEGQPVSEIAAIFNVSKATVKRAHNPQIFEN